MTRKKPSSGDYEVGYGKPPKATRFKAGQSGNPRGRPRATKSLDALVLEPLIEMMTVKENGKSRRMPRVQVYINTLFGRAVKGDAKAADQLLKVIALVRAGAAQEASTVAHDAAAGAAAELSATDEEVLKYFAAQIRAAGTSDEEPEA